MHPLATNILGLTFDVYRFAFGSADAPEIANEYSGLTGPKRWFGRGSTEGPFSPQLGHQRPCSPNSLGDFFVLRRPVESAPQAGIAIFYTVLV